MFEIIDRFSLWCKQKISLHAVAAAESQRQKFFKQGEVWWCRIGMNVGDEIFGKGDAFVRPVFVFKKLTGNTFLGLPITKREKVGSWYVKFRVDGDDRWVLLNQARVFDSRRLLGRVGAVSTRDFNIIRGRFVTFYSS